MLVALAVTYVAVYRGTGSDLRSQTDGDLTREVDSLTTSLVKGSAARPATGIRPGRRNSCLAQPFGPTSRVIAISDRRWRNSYQPAGAARPAASAGPRGRQSPRRAIRKVDSRTIETASRAVTATTAKAPGRLLGTSDGFSSIADRRRRRSPACSRRRQTCRWRLRRLSGSVSRWPRLTVLSTV